MSSIKTILEQRIEAIEYLINRDYPELDQVKLILPTDEDFKQAQVYIARADRDRMNLETWNIHELKEGVVQEKIKEVDEEREEFLKSEEGIKNLTHNQPSSKVNIDLWGKMASWNSLEEGSLLCQNIDPVKGKWKDNIEPFTKYCPIARKINENRLLISRAVEVGSLPEKAKPALFIAWAKRNNIDFPFELEKEIKKYDGDIVNFETVYKEKCTEVTILKDELEATKEELEKIKNKEKPLDPKEKTSLQIMVIAMAMKHYKFNPNATKNPATQNIKNTIESFGMNLDDTPILKHLKNAANDQVSAEVLSKLPLP